MADQTLRANKSFIREDYSGKPMTVEEFSDCRFEACDFTDADLIGSSFTESDLEKSIFQNTNLTKANFVGAKNYLIDPNRNKITKAKFSAPEALALLDFFEISIE